MSDQSRKYRVLFVDDEPRVTSALKAIFRREYSVTVANSGAMALELMQEQKFDVVVSDQRMPGMLGNELLAEVFKLYPQTMRILLTGFMDKKAIVDSINQGEIYRFINKPWRNDEMREVVAEAALASEIPVEQINWETESDSTDAVISSTNDEKVMPVVTEGSNAILMMEQAQDIRTKIRRFCSDHSIMIYGTQNVEQAVAAASSRENIGVAVIELSNDTRSAVQTINLLKQARPELITIALADEFDAHTAVDLINQGQVFKYLAKPIDLGGFEKAIQNAFVKHRFLKKNTAAQRRFKVEKNRDKIVSSLKGMFNRLLGSSSSKAT